MPVCKTFDKKIYRINQSQLNGLLNKFDEVKELCATVKHSDAVKMIFHKDDLKLFVCRDDETKKWFAIDNQDGYLFIEEFSIVQDAYIWLLDLKASEVLQKAEDLSFWW